jgi:hypothetical protein
MSKPKPPKKESDVPSRSAPDLSHYFKDIEEWPESWMIDRPDLATGQAILAVLEPFIRHLVNQGLSRRTLKRHIDNLWALGGETISKVNSEPSQREQSAIVLVMDAVDDEGGPLLNDAFGPDDQRSFDTTCRKLYRFLKSSA